MTDTIHVLHCGLCRKPFDMTLDPEHTLDPDRAGFICEACAKQEVELDKINEGMFAAHCAEQQKTEEIAARNQAQLRAFLKELIHECLDERESGQKSARS